MTWNWWGNAWYGGFASYFKEINSAFTIRKLRTSIRRALESDCASKYIPLEFYQYGNKNDIQRDVFFKVQIADNDLKFVDDNVERLPIAYTRVPDNHDRNDTAAMIAHCTGNTRLMSNMHYDGHLSDDWEEVIYEYFKAWSLMSYEEYRKIFLRPEDSANNAASRMGENSEWEGEDNDKKRFNPDYWDTRNELELDESNANELYSWFLKTISDRIIVTEDTEKEESLSKWKRVSKKFVQWVSYKPLIRKDVTTRWKKKIHIVMDSSGSMGCTMDRWKSLRRWTKSSYWDGYTSWDFGVALTYALQDSNVLEVTSFVNHWSSSWYNAIDYVNKWESNGLKFWWGWGWEWFENLSVNLPPSLKSEADMTVIITDLQYCEDAERWIFDYVQWTKHMIYSFWKPWNVKWLNVTMVNDPQDIIDSLATLAW